VATAPPVDVELVSRTGEARQLSEWLTTFPLLLGAVDPYTHESAWLLPTMTRVFRAFAGADCRVAWLVTAPATACEQFLGPLADEFLTFADPDRTVVKSLGLSTLPALVVIRQDGSLLGAAEGWDAAGWRSVTDDLARLTGWSRVTLPVAGDPVAYPGTPALG
jgi:hypothetical protein